MMIAGTYAFFDASGRLRTDAFTRQVNAGLVAGASDIAVLGLVTEASKPGRDERRQIVDRVVNSIVKAESSVVSVDGMMPGIETVNLPVSIEKAMRVDDKAEAKATCRKLLPAIIFAMQNLLSFLLHEKLPAALRLGIEPSHRPIPADNADATSCTMGTTICR